VALLSADYEEVGFNFVTNLLQRLPRVNQALGEYRNELETPHQHRAVLAREDLSQEGTFRGQIAGKGRKSMAKSHLALVTPANCYWDSAARPTAQAST
jgi:hypothetical protein